MLRVVSGLAGIALLTFAGISVGSPPVVFFDVPSVVLVLGIVGFGTLVSFPVAQVVAACSLSSDPASAAPVFHRMADLAVSSGIFGVLIGLVQMLQALDDPSAIGPAMAHQEAVLAPLEHLEQRQLRVGRPQRADLVEYLGAEGLR